MPSFLHSGRVGDLIFALSVMRELGGGNLYLNPNFRTYSRLNGMHPIEQVIPFLQTQSYLDKVCRWNREHVDYDFRDFPNRSLRAGRAVNLVDMHRSVCKLPLVSANHLQPWLDIDKPRTIPGRGVVLHRSMHYRNVRFPWGTFLDRFRSQAFFVGLPEEYQDFINKYGWVEYVQTPDINELARVVAGATTFIGNQGAPYAIAEGLKKPVVLEAYAEAPSCIFPRPKIWYYWCSTRPKWPSVYEFSKCSDQCWEF